MKPHPTNPRADRVDGLVLVVILLIVAGFAGAASFTHVKDWTLDNSPPGTGAWFGWANAVISELVPIAALLTIRRRRRTGGPIGYPMFLLIAAVTLSLAAQLAVAKPGLSGWLLSAVPALAFMGLSKLVLTTAPTPADEPAPTPTPGPTLAPAAPAPAAAVPARPVTDTVPPAHPVEQTGPPAQEAPPVTAAPATPAPVVPEPVAVAPIAPARSGPLAPVSPAAFVRRNGTPLVGEVTR
ncbi:hypothetical protein GA0070610_1210 [Micromonospora echinofusca]|uniref:DUF2637 domain-containing protein n=1 Tax=Micromonospora echinofusca TaxID=47858 RepID=A0A1C5G513_MICEH|nr:DUF2637 domain-containing protein [Micromonospora echinofusca]SCG14985.1 hypothetical protein GA0070610_1210 [Micromonospora echinofusca]